VHEYVAFSTIKVGDGPPDPGAGHGKVLLDGAVWRIVASMSSAVTLTWPWLGPLLSQRGKIKSMSSDVEENREHQPAGPSHSGKLRQRLPINLGTAAGLVALVSLVGQKLRGAFVLGAVGALLGLLYIVQSRGQMVGRGAIAAVMATTLGALTMGISLYSVIESPDNADNADNTDNVGDAGSEPAAVPQTPEQPASSTTGIAGTSSTTSAASPTPTGAPDSASSGPTTARSTSTMAAPSAGPSIVRFSDEVLFGAAEFGLDVDRNPPGQSVADHMTDLRSGYIGDVYMGSASGADWPGEVMPSKEQCAALVSQPTLPSGHLFLEFDPDTSFCVRTSEDRIAFIRVNSVNTDGHLLGLTVWD